MYEKQIRNNINIPSDKLNIIIKKMTITKVEQPFRDVFTKPYDKVVEIRIEAGIEHNAVSFMISQRENFLIDIPTFQKVSLKD